MTRRHTTGGGVASGCGDLTLVSDVDSQGGATFIESELHVTNCVGRASSLVHSHSRGALRRHRRVPILMEDSSL